ncbi:MAG: BREX system P-loop protein BrxC, partial [Anaerolineae bacterium]|nr:BREX system P-loop protein BrxC [Anaerolineae bacterium]
MKKIREILLRDPDRLIETVIKINDRDPQRVWVEMDEYVPTERVKQYFGEILDALLETRSGPTERVCIWIAGFFGSGKSHFLKVLGYLLQDQPLQDHQGRVVRSQSFLCEKLGLQNYLPILQKEFKPHVFFINLLNYDPLAPDRPTLSRLIYQAMLEEEGFSTTFWVAAWERELHDLGRWEDFNRWVQEQYGRSWQEERKLNAEVVLRRALPFILSDRYQDEAAAASALQESKKTYTQVTPSQVAQDLRRYAEKADPQKGRTVVLLDEVGLYIGEDLERLTDLKSLAEQVVQEGKGKVLLIATAQEALTDLVPKLTRDRDILGYLRDRFRLALLLEPTEVPTVVARRLLEKNQAGAETLRELLSRHRGALRAALTLADWSDEEFIGQYPCHPYAVRLVQDIQAGMRGSIEEQRRLSRSERSLLKLTHAILRGEGGITRGADQPVGWLASLDLFYDAMQSDLEAVRSDQVRAMEEIARLGEANGLPVVRVAKALFLLQQVAARSPCTPDRIAAALVDRIETDLHSLRYAVEAALRRLQQAGWAVEENGQYRLLTPTEHTLERDVHQNYPTPAEIGQRAAELARDLLRPFRYEHGQIRRQISLSVGVDDEL